MADRDAAGPDVGEPICVRFYGDGCGAAGLDRRRLQDGGEGDVAGVMPRTWRPLLPRGERWLCRLSRREWPRVGRDGMEGFSRSSAAGRPPSNRFAFPGGSENHGHWAGRGRLAPWEEASTAGVVAGLAALTAGFPLFRPCPVT